MRSKIMLPHQIRIAIAENWPVVLPLGVLEYHGKHGADSNETIGLHGEQREYGIGAQILTSLNIRSMRILTNHPRKLVALEAYGLKIVAQVPLSTVRSKR